MNCNNCGKPNPRTSRVCPDCGYTLGKKYQVGSPNKNQTIQEEHNSQKQGTTSVLVSIFVSVTIIIFGVFLALSA